jgi:hypothetical protein
VPDLGLPSMKKGFLSMASKENTFYFLAVTIQADCLLESAKITQFFQ